MKEDISQELQEEALTRLNTACLHAELHGDRAKRGAYHEQVTQIRQWFNEHDIQLFVQGNQYAFSPHPQTGTLSFAQHQVVVDGVPVYEGDDLHAACRVLLDYARDARPRHVRYVMRRCEVPAGTDPQTLLWDWTADLATEDELAPQAEEFINRLLTVLREKMAAEARIQQLESVLLEAIDYLILGKSRLTLSQAAQRNILLKQARQLLGADHANAERESS